MNPFLIRRRTILRERQPHQAASGLELKEIADEQHLAKLSLSFVLAHVRSETTPAHAVLDITLDTCAVKIHPRQAVLRLGAAELRSSIREHFPRALWVAFDARIGDAGSVFSHL